MGAQVGFTEGADRALAGGTCAARVYGTGGTPQQSPARAGGRVASRTTRGTRHRGGVDGFDPCHRRTSSCRRAPAPRRCRAAGSRSRSRRRKLERDRRSRHGVPSAIWHEETSGPPSRHACRCHAMAGHCTVGRRRRSRAVPLRGAASCRDDGKMALPSCRAERAVHRRACRPFDDRSAGRARRSGRHRASDARSPRDAGEDGRSRHAGQKTCPPRRDGTSQMECGGKRFRWRAAEKHGTRCLPPSRCANGRRRFRARSLARLLETSACGGRQRAGRLPRRSADA